MTSLSTFSVIMGGVSSTQITLPIIDFAFLAKRWAALLQFLWTWTALHELKHRRLCLEPSTTSWIDHGRGATFESVEATIRASHSIITSFKPRSQAKRIPFSTATASVSRAFRGNSILLLITPINWPLSFLMTTPIPQHPASLKIAPLA